MLRGDAFEFGMLLYTHRHPWLCSERLLPLGARLGWAALRSSRVTLRCVRRALQRVPPRLLSLLECNSAARKAI